MPLSGIPGRDKEKFNMARELVTQAMAETMDLYGITPSIGRLYGIMYFADSPMNLDEMASELGMSKTSMSTAARALLDIKMVEKAWQKGVRKDLYVAEKDFFKMFKDFFCRGWRREIEVNMKAIEKAMPILRELAESDNEETRKLAQKDIYRLEQARDYYLWLGRLVDTVESGKIFDYIPKKIT